MCVCFIVVCGSVVRPPGALYLFQLGKYMHSTVLRFWLFTCIIYSVGFMLKMSCVVRVSLTAWKG